MLLVLNLNLSAKPYTKECKNGNRDGCIHLGVVYLKDNSTKTTTITKEPTQNELYIKSCKNGNMNKCVKLGIIYFTGNGVEKDYLKAEELFIKACKSRHSKACYYLGTMYKRGSKGIKKDIKKAKIFYAKGCMNGYAQSCDQYNLIKEKSKEIGSESNAKFYRYNTEAYGG